MELEKQSCPRCNISGIHACPGKPLPKPSPEDEQRLRNALDIVFAEEARDVKQEAETRAG